MSTWLTAPNFRQIGPNLALHEQSSLVVKFDNVNKPKEIVDLEWLKPRMNAVFESFRDRIPFDENERLAYRPGSNIVSGLDLQDVLKHLKQESLEICGECLQVCFPSPIDHQLYQFHLTGNCHGSEAPLIKSRGVRVKTDGLLFVLDENEMKKVRDVDYEFGPVYPHEIASAVVSGVAETPEEVSEEPVMLPEDVVDDAEDVVDDAEDVVDEGFEDVADDDFEDVPEETPSPPPQMSPPKEPDMITDPLEVSTERETASKESSPPQQHDIYTPPAKSPNPPNPPNPPKPTKSAKPTMPTMPIKEVNIQAPDLYKIGPNLFIHKPTNLIISTSTANSKALLIDPSINAARFHYFLYPELRHLDLQAKDFSDFYKYVGEPHRKNFAIMRDHDSLADVLQPAKLVICPGCRMDCQLWPANGVLSPNSRIRKHIAECRSAPPWPWPISWGFATQRFSPKTYLIMETEQTDRIYGQAMVNRNAFSPLHTLLYE